MKVYVDIIFLLNMFLDMMLLISVNIILRRNTCFKRILLGSLIGGVSIIFLFLKINTFELFIFKIAVSILMVLSTFGFKNIYYTLKNIFYLYVSSIVLGGFLYFLNIQFSYEQKGLVFYHNGLSINFIFLVITSPIIIYIYIVQAKELKNKYSNFYEVDIYKDDKKYSFKGFMDTGNVLVDPYFNKPVIIVDTTKIKYDHYILVPIKTIKEEGMLKCIKVDKVDIKGIGIKKNILVGFSDIKLEGVDCILNFKLMG